MTGVLSNWRGYLELTKPGVQALLFVSCASGMLIGSDFNPPIEVFFFGLIGISFLAASSAVINHFFDKQIDSKMIRTSERPLVMGDITDKAAISFSILLYVVGILTAGLIKRNSKKGESEYLLAGRRLTIIPFTASLVATWYGGILGIGEFTYQYGISNWVVMGLPYYIFASIFAFLFAKKIIVSVC